MTSVIQDLRHGFRLLFRQKGFTAVAALVLALGIGANTAVFSLVNSLVLKPRLGAPDVELAGVYSRDRTQPDSYRGFSYPNYADLRERTDLFRSLAAHTFAMVGMGDGEATRRVFVNITTANFFDTFGVSLLFGRAFFGRRGTARRGHARDDPQLQRVAATGRQPRDPRQAGSSERTRLHRDRRRAARVRRISDARIAGALAADRASTTRSPTTSSATGCRRRWRTGATIR